MLLVPLLSCVAAFIIYQRSADAVELDDFRYVLGIGRNQLSDGPSLDRWDYLIYGGYARFASDTSDLFDDDALYSLAWQAYEEMRTDYNQLERSCRADGAPYVTAMPTLIAALAIGDEVFFSSQMKGTSGFKSVYSTRLANADITQQLRLCQSYLRTEANPRVPNAVPEHTTGACAEIYATAMYMKQHDNQSPRTVTQDQSTKARVAVWGTYPHNIDKSKGYGIAPCAPSSVTTRWGCSAFMRYQGITIIKNPKFDPANRERDDWPDLPINQIEPVEVKNEGVPLARVAESASSSSDYGEVDFDDMDFKPRL
ncbi:MAG: hypothetical protein Q9184_003727 [Pyrenodesmia sp. 2 TL-2023]